MAAVASAPAEQRLAAGAFDHSPYGIMVCDRRGRVTAANARLQEIVGAFPRSERRPASCCSVLGCDGGASPGNVCLTTRALAAGELAERRMARLPAGAGPVWVAAARMYENGSHVVFQVRPESPRAPAAPQLRIFALGSLRIEDAAGPMTGEWLDQRPGQLLRFLACRRHAVTSADVIAEAIWPRAGAAAQNTVRHFVHALRGRLEPARAKHGESSFVVCHRGGYALHPDRVWIDAEEFERLARSGLSLLAGGAPDAARSRLERAVGLYADDLVADEPYADWALGERERLRALAGDALQALADLDRADPAAAVSHLERLAELEPLDSDVQRQLICALLALGRRSRATRRYDSFRVRLLRHFGERPDFELARLP